LRHNITISPTDREDRYRVRGAVALDSMASPIPDAARALKANGGSDDDLVHVNWRDCTVVPQTIGAILKSCPTPNRHAAVREMLNLPPR
jgi:hypothetical protein